MNKTKTPCVLLNNFFLFFVAPINLTNAQPAVEVYFSNSVQNNSI